MNLAAHSTTMNHSSDQVHTHTAMVTILELEDGDELAGSWSTPEHDRFGTFRLLLKRTPDNRLLWAHYIQAPDGTTGMVIRGELRHPDELKQLQDTIHRTIRKVTGEELRLEDSDYLASSADGNSLRPVQE